MSGRQKAWKILLKVLGILVSVVLLALAVVSLVLAKPQEEPEQPASAGLPAISASPAMEILDENDLYQLVSAFPAPVMSFMSGSGMTFVSATASDAAVSGSFARVATLYWQTPEGEPMILRSIYPADALSLLEDGFHFSTWIGPTLFGNPSVRMENGEAIRIHTATDRGLYVVTLPRTLGDRVSGLCRSLQLFTVNPTD